MADEGSNPTPAPDPTYSPDLYNTLRSVEDADSILWSYRKTILPRVAILLDKYNQNLEDYQFGVCLVHRHAELKQDEWMVSRGSVSQPETDVDCYPERWLATGEPFEFNIEPTVPPPDDLRQEFQVAVKEVEDVYPHLLGLAYIPTDDRIKPGMVYLEHTEGRKNITEIARVRSVNTINTCWLPDEEDLVRICYQCSQVAPTGHTKTATCVPGNNFYPMVETFARLIE